MEKLTDKFNDGTVGVINIHDNSELIELDSLIKDGVELASICGAIDKLFEYEKTGLTPEEIKYFKEVHSNIIKFVMDKKNVDRKYSCLLEVFDKQQKEIASLKEALKQALKGLEG